MPSGVYCLVLKNDPCTVRVGALGPIPFPGGFHAYVGSALGPGGLARVARHIRCAGAGVNRPHWHIDYLLGSDRFILESVFSITTQERLECLFASLVGGKPVPGFGCSDCRCHAHLFSFPGHPRANIEQAASILGLSAFSKTIKTSEVDC